MHPPSSPLRSAPVGRRAAAFVAALLAAPCVQASDAVVDVLWRSDALHAVDGGVDPGFRHIGQLDVAASGATDTTAGRTRWMLSGFVNTGDSFTDRVGDLQVVSNIEANGGEARLNEAWVEHRFGRGGPSLLIGKYDVNGEFDVLDAALPFVNSAFGIGTDIGQTGRNGPSIFPATALAVRLDVPFSERLRLRVAVTDGVPGEPGRPGRTDDVLSASQGALVIAEFEGTVEQGRWLAGYWEYTSPFEPLCAGTPGCVRGDRNRGAYLRGEHRLLDVEAAPTRVDGFVRIGHAAQAFNPMDDYLSAGVRFSEFAAGRPEDSAGLAFSYGALSTAYARASDGRVERGGHEGAVELFYRARVARGAFLQPLVQWIDDPGGFEGVDDAWVLGLRLEIGRSFPLGSGR